MSSSSCKRRPSDCVLIDDTRENCNSATALGAHAHPLPGRRRAAPVAVGTGLVMKHSRRSLLVRMVLLVPVGLVGLALRGSELPQDMPDFEYDPVAVSVDAQTLGDENSHDADSVSVGSSVLSTWLSYEPGQGDRLMLQTLNGPRRGSSTNGRRRTAPDSGAPDADGLDVEPLHPHGGGFRSPALTTGMSMRWFMTWSSGKTGIPVQLRLPNTHQIQTCGGRCKPRDTVVNVPAFGQR